MLSFLTSSVGLRLAGIVGATLIAAWAINAAYQAGRTAERTAILNRSVEILRERNHVDDEVRDMDAVGLCAALGGLPDECAGLGL